LRAVIGDGSGAWMVKSRYHGGAGAEAGAGAP